MANSRKSPNRNKSGDLQAAFARALGDILARVCISATEGSAQPTEGSADSTTRSERSFGRPSIAIAYSGGLDSSVLLYLGSQYALAHDVSLYAFHVHHGLSQNADAWAAHCQTEAVKYAVSFAQCTVDISRNDKRGVEEAARIARYAGLGDLCRQHGISLLLTAHHEDDQAETVMLQLMRGAGLPGLSGMALFQQQHDLLGPDVALGRPLLGMSRGALEEAAQQFDLTHVSDESNTDIRYRRNALRHTVSPVIETHFPGFGSLVARAAAHAQSAQALLHELALIDLDACKADSEGRALNLPELKKLSTQRIDNLLRHWLYMHGVQLPSTSRLDEIRMQMLTAATDTHPFFDFAHVKLHRIENRLELHPNFGMPPCDPLILHWQGQREIIVPQWSGRLIFEKTEGLGLAAGWLRKTALTICPRGGKERLKIAANRPSKDLKSLFQEFSIAPWQRKWSPLFYLDSDLVFVANLGMDARHTTQGESIALRWEMA